MRFDWHQDSKERYFRIAEERIEAAGFTGFLCIDRSQFGVVGEKSVKVYMQPIHRKGNMRQWWEAKRSIKSLKELSPPRDQFGRKTKPIFLKLYFEIEMEASESES